MTGCGHHDMTQCPCAHNRLVDCTVKPKQVVPSSFQSVLKVLQILATQNPVLAIDFDGAVVTR